MNRLPRRSSTTSSIRATTSGMTQVELLAALVVVLILLGLLIPALGAAQHSFRASASVARMRNLGHALLASAAERGGRLPDLASADDPPKPWDAAILPYLGSPHGGELFRCPLDTVRAAPGQARRSFGMTAVALGFPPWDGGDHDRPPGQGILLARIGEPARFVMLTRVTRGWEMPENFVGNVAFCAFNGIDPRDPASADWDLFRGKTPYGFADGHVALVTPDEAREIDPPGWTFDNEELEPRP